MPHLTTDLRPEDHARVYRTVIAWMTGDNGALDAVLIEADAEPAGIPLLLFAMIDHIVKMFAATGLSHDDVLAAIRADLLDLAAQYPEADA